ncbi:hypothetical protein BJP34_26705 [Moorena producens PAL-8-15-08-1]|uniref:Uncharacterized protein n=1 Tax=Moorena producens PAL-8-15-08-1 TaxID=1458985 RepID=A0A1D8TYB9_9CYAN|nr:hypothetical protein [Moorena producens]AOX02555.1 hypothetical protein BJP34_26705 [Moorena producens PAL-8-15-08-1]
MHNNLIIIIKYRQGSRGGCISLKLFDSVVRYGVGYFNGGEEVENQGEPTPNAPYAKFTTRTDFYSLLGNQV